MYHIFGKKKYHFYLHWRIFWARKLWFSVISTREVNNYTLPRLFLWLLDSCQQKNINIPDCLKYFFNKRVFHDDCLDSKGYLTIKYPKDTVSFVCMQVSGIFYQQSWPFTFCFFLFFVGAWSAYLSLSERKYTHKCCLSLIITYYFLYVYTVSSLL